MEMQMGRSKKLDRSEMQLPTWSERVQGGQNALPHQPNRGDTDLLYIQYKTPVFVFVFLNS